MKLNYIVIPLITILVSFLGSSITTRGMEWYGGINLPSWTPSGGVIGGAWTIIFILSTISALLIWNTADRSSKFWWIIGIFLLNILLNILWSYIFFGVHQLGLATIEAGVLGLSVLVLIFLSWPISKIASVFLMPYAAWVIFATHLTYVVWTLN